MAVSALNKRLKVIAGINAVFVLVYIANVALNGYIAKFGILPRDMATWYHIFFSPFIHGSTTHLVNNMIGFSVLAGVCLIRSLSLFFWNSVGIIVIGGALVWVFGRESFHIGASGWIFGLWSLAIATAWFNRKFIYIVAAIAVLFFYGGMFFGMLPSDPRISFEAHLFGAIAGVICAAISGKRH